MIQHSCPWPHMAHDWKCGLSTMRWCCRQKMHTRFGRLNARKNAKYCINILYYVLKRQYCCCRQKMHTRFGRLNVRKNAKYCINILYYVLIRQYFRHIKILIKFHFLLIFLKCGYQKRLKLDTCCTSVGQCSSRPGAVGR